MSTKATFDGVTPDEMTHVKDHFESHGLLKGDTTSGVATVHDVPMDYTYDEDSRMLTVEIREPSERMSTEKIQDLVGRIRLSRKVSTMGLGPGYNHVHVTLNNTSGKTLIYSKDSIDNGVIDIKVQDAETGKKQEIFEARSSMASGLGCKGNVTYQIDSQTTLSISYHLNGKGIYGFNVGIEGHNASMYKVSKSNTGAKYDCAGAYTYMKPQVAIERT